MKKHFILGFVIILAFTQLSFAKKTAPKQAVKGSIDLSNWNFQEDGNIKLDGEWEFYWKTFINDSSDNFDHLIKSYVKLPELWNNQFKNTEQKPGQGYCSYRLRVSLKKPQDLAIKFINAATSYEIFIDGKSYFSAGVPGKSKSSTVASYAPSIIRFTPEHNNFEIVIHVSNFHHKKGGMWESVLLGSQHTIEQHHNRIIFIDIFFIGCIFIVSIFHFILYSQHKSDRASLWFSFFTLLISIRLAVTGHFSIYLLGDLPWALIVRSDYLSYYLVILFFTLFLKTLYPHDFKKIPIYAIIATTIGFSISVLFLPPISFTYSIQYFQAFSIIAGVYAFAIIFQAIKKRRNGAKMFLYGFIILFAGLVHDVLKQNGIIESINLVSFALIIFILFQASILSTRVQIALAANKKLSKHLNTKNYQLQLAKIKAEESDNFKSTFLANMSHEIRTPMNGIIGFSELLSQDDFSPNEKGEFIKIINERSKQLLGIVNDIIDITKIETGQIELAYSETNIDAMLNELYSNYNHSADNKVKIINHNSLGNNDIVIMTDDIKLRQILDNLISNALKFTKQGSIEFGCKQNEEYLHFFVTDTGIGISKEEADKVFDRFNQANESISKKYGGTGLGLAIAKAYTEKLGGKIWMNSEKGKGSSFYINIPNQHN